MRRPARRVGAPCAAPPPEHKHTICPLPPGCFPVQDKGVFSQKSQSRSMQETMATDPSVMVDMMKKNLTGMVPQVGPCVCVGLKGGRGFPHGRWTK